MLKSLNYKKKLSLLLIIYSLAITTMVLFLGFELFNKVFQPEGNDIEQIYITSNYKELEEGINKGVLSTSGNIISKVVTNNELENLYINQFLKKLMQIMILVSFIIMVLSVILSKFISKQFLQPIESVSSVLANIDNMENINLDNDIFNEDLSGVKKSLQKSSTKIKKLLNEANSINSYITHEQKNTLAILRAKIQLGEKEELLDLVDKMSASLDDILALNAIESFGTFEEIDLCTVCAQAVETYSRTYSDIELEFDEYDMPIIEGKELWIYRAVCNLIENAIKYGDNSKIVVKVYQNKNSAIICVKDEGRGMNKADLDKIFNYKYRCENLNKNGYGIGLSLVNHVVEICGGITYVESEIGKGSNFYMVFKALTLD